jgi:hypothetical protein
LSRAAPTAGGELEVADALRQVAAHHGVVRHDNLDGVDLQQQRRQRRVAVGWAPGGGPRALLCKCMRMMAMACQVLRDPEPD